MKPSRGLVFVRRVKTADTLAGGHISLLDSTREAWTSMQAEILDVGEPAFCEDIDACGRLHHVGTAKTLAHPHALRVGAWVLVAPRSFVAVTDRVWAVTQDNVLAIIEDA